MPATTAPAEPAPLRLRARAKVNLYLHVLGRRDDGYHLIDSLIGFAELGDTLTLRPADTLRLALGGPMAAALRQALLTPADNIVLRAAAALGRAQGIDAGAEMRLTKRLPHAAGLGGGSSDAAAALLGLARLWATEPTPARLHGIALALGADVPACLCQPAPHFVGGIGERLRPAPALPPAALLLVNPGLTLPTAEVFGRLSARRSAPAGFSAPAGDARELAALLAERRNDLEPAARRIRPEIDQVLSDLRALPGLLLARMSGSGATCFGLFATLAEARRARATLAAERPGWWLAATRLASPLRAGAQAGARRRRVSGRHASGSPPSR